jgi:putative cell wall-binding protein
MRRGGASTHHPGTWFALSIHLVTRLAGDNRYATAAAASAHTYPSPAAVDTVFIATGIDYPDALAGAAVAGRDGAPLLLVAPGSLPAATAAEIARLGPSTIVLLGGPVAVSPAVETALSAYGTILRLAGPNRYATAVEISKHAYPADGSADAVIIATGTNFADALAGAPAAAKLNGPVLLTRGDSLPQVTRDEIARLAPDEILVIGGPNAVSDAVLADLDALAPTRRVAGANRYETAVALSTDVFDTAELMYVATGLNFPDALAGAAAAATRGVPLLLVPGSSVPASVLAEITRLGGGTILILGGSAVVSNGVQSTLTFAGL